jgi:hypothetical protein
MTVHCAGRFGILSWIYTQRHVIAFELGLSSERPIAECRADYHSDGLVIIQQDASSAVPSAVFHAKEINLFFSVCVFDIRNDALLIDSEYSLGAIPKIPPAPIQAIFHPPSIA